MCRPTIRTLGQMKVPFVTSLGVGERLEKFGVDPSAITELDWWEEHAIGGLKLTATPAQHFSGRGLRDRNATLWSSWVLETSEHNVFFSADTGLTDELALIGRRFGPFDLIMQYRYGGLYWVFNFVMEKKYLLLCQACGRGWELQPSAVEGRIKAPSIPFMRRYGLASLAGVIGFFILLDIVGSMRGKQHGPPAPAPSATASPVVAG